MTWSSSETSQHARVARGGIHVVVKDVPSGKYEVVEPGERHELVEFRRTTLGAFAQADGSHLRQRADGGGDSLAHGFDARDKCSGDGAHTRNHDPELAFGGGDLAFDGIRISLLLRVGMLSVRFMKECTNPLSSRNRSRQCNGTRVNGRVCDLCGNLKDLVETMVEEKIALVTGSSSGIGLLTAVELALNGYRVVATMRNLESRGRLEEAARKLAYAIGSTCAVSISQNSIRCLARWTQSSATMAASMCW